MSLNEVAAQARKAARGAGYAWGMADEASRATRWLCEQGVDGCTALARCLDAAASGDLCVTPRVTDMNWRSSDERPLCPLHTGAALSDRGAVFATPGAGLDLRAVAVPLLLLPFFARAASQIAAPLSVDTQGTRYLVAADVLDPAQDLSVAPADLHISRSDKSPANRPTATRVIPDANAWASLTRFAHRTYAPATEASRQKGAGGDFPDTD